MKYYLNILFISFICGFNFQLKAENKPVLKFHVKTCKIGEPIKVSFSYKHHKDKEVLLPDTLYNFSPFEFVKKEVFPTKTTGNMSIDSVVLTLNTFELVQPLNLSLPVFIYSKKDTNIIYSNTESIVLQKLINNKNPDLTLKSNTKFLAIEPSFDYIFWSVLILGIIIFIIGSYMLFGKPIKRQIKLYLTKMAYENFIQDFEKTINLLNKRKNHADLDKLLGLWKKYLQNTTNKPTTTYTSKEISEYINNDKLLIALNSIDRTIYGGAFEESVIEETTILKIIAKEYYIKKQEEVKNE